MELAINLYCLVLLVLIMIKVAYISNRWKNVNPSDCKIRSPHEFSAYYRHSKFAGMYSNDMFGKRLVIYCKDYHYKLFEIIYLTQ